MSPSRTSRHCHRTSTRSGTLSSTLRQGCGWVCGTLALNRWHVGGAGRGGSAQHPVHASRHATRPQIWSGNCIAWVSPLDLFLEGFGSAYKKRPHKVRQGALQVHPGLPPLWNAVV